MRGELLFKALRILHETAYTADEFFAALDVIVPPHGTSVASVLSGWHRKRYGQMSSANEEYRKLHNLFSRLKHDNLVAVSEKGLLTLSFRGRTKLRSLKNRSAQQRDYKRYKADDDGVTRIVSFDIPEHRRIQRAWLRGALKHLGYKMRQQSLWIGTTKLPETFLQDLVDLRLVKFIDILGVTKRGTLKDIL